jgi:hypothetical protein
MFRQGCGIPDGLRQEDAQAGLLCRGEIGLRQVQQPRDLDARPGEERLGVLVAEDLPHGEQDDLLHAFGIGDLAMEHGRSTLIGRNPRGTAYPDFNLDSGASVDRPPG